MTRGESASTRRLASRVALLTLAAGLAACGRPGPGPVPDGVPPASRLEAASPVVDLTGATADDWIPLFDGRSLDGWIPKIRGHAAGEDAMRTFRVEDGGITVSYEGYETFGETFGHVFYRQPFSWYVLEVEYRFFGDQLPDGPGWAYRNSGVMVHGQTPESMGIDQDFPVSIEVQLLGGNGTEERSTANLCTPGTNVVFEGKLDTRHCIESSSGTYHGDDWVTASVTVLGDSLVVHAVEGQEVLRYEAPQLGGGSVSGHDPERFPDGAPLTSGTISLQSESHPVQFRRVMLLDLSGCMDPRSPSYRPYFVHDDPARCAD